MNFKKVIVLVVIIFFSNIAIASTNQNLKMLTQLKEVLLNLQERQVKLQQQYEEYERLCEKSSYGYRLNIIGFEPINNALGGENTNDCKKKEQLNIQIQYLGNKQKEIVLIMQEIKDNSKQELSQAIYDNNINS